MAVLCGTLTGFASALRDAGAAAPAIQRILPCEHTVCHMPILLHCPQSLVKSDQLNPAALRDAGDDSDVSQFDVVVIDEASQVLPPTGAVSYERGPPVSYERGTPGSCFL